MYNLKLAKTFAMVLKTSTEIQVDFNDSYPLYESVLCAESSGLRIQTSSIVPSMRILLTAADNSYTIFK